MAFGGFDSKGSGSGAVSEINMVPLIDVMLVLLVIFIITAPLLAHSIKINVPQVSAEQIQEDPEVIDLAIDVSGNVFFNEQPIAVDALQARFASMASTKPQPEIRIRADQSTRYEVLAQVMAAARRGGMQRIGFVTSPQPASAASQAAAAAQAPAGTTPPASLPRAPGAAGSGAASGSAAPAAGTGAGQPAPAGR